MGEYVILQEEQIRVVRDGLAGEPYRDWIPVRRADRKLVKVEGTSQQDAVDNYGAEEGVKGGRFKAVALTNWKGVIPLKEKTQVLSSVEEDDDL